MADKPNNESNLQDNSSYYHENDSKRALKQKKPFRFDLINSLIILSLLVIVGGSAYFGYLMWHFKSESLTKAAESEGLVPVVGDFSANKAKKTDILFRMAGKRRDGEMLFSELVAAWMRARNFNGVSVSTENNIITISGTKDGKKQRVVIALGSAKGAFDAMTQNRVEAVMASRPIESSEADKLSAFGDMTAPSNEKVIAHDVSYVFVNKGNNVVNLNANTLSRILAGEISDWSEISDKMQGDIKIYYEDDGADKASGLLAKLLGDKELVDSAKGFRTPKEVIDAVTADKGAIGFAHRINNSDGNVQPVSMSEHNARNFDPNEFNIATEAYPFTERVYLYIGSSNADPSAKDFAEFAMSQAGQDVVKRLGFGAQIPQAYTMTAPADAPDDYASFAKGARRMNFDFRFQYGTNTLDSKAEADIKRLIEYMKKQNVDQKQLALFGFADNVGAKQTNIGLAQSRVTKVVSKLSEIGIQPSVLRAYGDAMPVGANALEEGRIKNRRVELWICPPPSCPLVNIVDSAGDSSSKMPTVSNGLPTGVHLGPSNKDNDDENIKG